MVRDITERKRAEAALLESNAQFRTLFEASPDAIMLIDPHDNWPILDCNTASCHMNGYTRDELTFGQSIDVLNISQAFRLNTRRIWSKSGRAASCAWRPTTAVRMGPCFPSKCEPP